MAKSRKRKRKRSTTETPVLSSKPLGKSLCMFMCICVWFVCTCLGKKNWFVQGLFRPLFAKMPRTAYFFEEGLIRPLFIIVKRKDHAVVNTAYIPIHNLRHESG